MRVVILGGTSGIGLATAEKLTATGAEVIVTGRDAEKLAAVKDRVAGAERVDGTDEQAVAEFFERVGSFDHLVLAFSPGALGLGPLAGLKVADIRSAFDGKLFAYLSAVQKARVTGSITFVSAATARSAVPGTVTFAAVNGAIERIVSPLAAELSPVRVNAVAPGAVDTPWWSFVPEEARAGQFTAMAQDLPIKRVGKPGEVADAIAYLVGAEYVTGTILPVDGGFTVA
ncbi:SDR family oxidoreductase [Streptomyces sp. NPDC059894]|uniref:SDR family oxidoreductase n=1 Tax=unclassified Streptomyces TaxID=2593676 RepID=UPI003655F478